jgi:hypothetical protein
LCTFLLNLNERKTSDSDVLPFFADAESMYVDIFHALACYLILGGGKADERSGTADRWIFPSLAISHRSASKKMTGFIRDGIKNSGDPLLAASHLDFSMKGTREGSTMHCTMHPRVSDIALITRGGWSCESICKVFSYITSDIALVSIAGKALSGWANPAEKVYSPTLVFLNPENH